MWTELENEEQMSVIDVRRTPSNQFERPPPLPAMDDPAVYMQYKSPNERIMFMTE